MDGYIFKRQVGLFITEMNILLVHSAVFPCVWFFFTVNKIVG